MIEVEVGVIDCLTLLIYHESCHQKKQEGAKTEIGKKIKKTEISATKKLKTEIRNKKLKGAKKENCVSLFRTPDLQVKASILSFFFCQENMDLMQNFIK